MYLKSKRNCSLQLPENEGIEWKNIAVPFVQYGALAVTNVRRSQASNGCESACKENCMRRGVISSIFPANAVLVVLDVIDVAQQAFWF